MWCLHGKMPSDLPCLLLCACLTFTEAVGNDTGGSDTAKQLNWASSHEENTHPRLTAIDSLLCMYPFQAAFHHVLLRWLCGICVSLFLCGREGVRCHGHSYKSMCDGWGDNYYCSPTVNMLLINTSKHMRIIFSSHQSANYGTDIVTVGEQQQRVPVNVLWCQWQATTTRWHSQTQREHCWCLSQWALVFWGLSLLSKRQLWKREREERKTEERRMPTELQQQC